MVRSLSHVGVGPVVVQEGVQRGVEHVDGGVGTVGAAVLHRVPSQHHQHQQRQEQHSKEQAQDDQLDGLVEPGDTGREKDIKITKNQQLF